MKKITLVLASAILALSATIGVAGEGQADRFNEASSYPTQASDSAQLDRISNK